MVGTTRSHRRVTVPAAVLLFISLGVPIGVVHGHHLEFGFDRFLPVVLLHVTAMLVALMARAPGAGASLLPMRVLAWVTTAAMLLWSTISYDDGRPPASTFEVAMLVLGVLVILALFGVRRRDELAAARATMATGLAGILFYGRLIGDGGAGIYVAFAAALGVLVGGLEWRREIVRGRRPDVPAARINAAARGG